MVSIFERKHPPRFVHVCGHRIPVKVHRRAMVDDNDDPLLGAFRSDVLEIHLARHENWRSTLLHEITHAILFLTGANQGLSLNTEERLVVAIENGLMPLIKRSEKHSQRNSL